MTSAIRKRAATDTGTVEIELALVLALLDQRDEIAHESPKGIAQSRLMFEDADERVLLRTSDGRHPLLLALDQRR